VAEPELIDDLVMAHRILVREGVLDAFGHVSVRDPENAGLFWLARALPPSVVAAGDMIAFDMDAEPVRQTDAPLYAERFIHSEVYRARPDVSAVCHHHAPSIMPFCITSRPLVPVSQTGAFMGGPVPVWDSADAFGDTALLIVDQAQGRSLAARLGQGALVLMRGHGVTVVGSTISELVFRSVYSRREAEHHLSAAAFGAPQPLSPGEIEKARQVRPPVLDRCWRHWLSAMQASRPRGDGR
jgi:ribulose-5-phosphate 4-epimerase/fuculose-1-phosphate aldolase